MQESSYPQVPDHCIRCVMIGDVVGKPGMRIACLAANWIRSRLHGEFLIVNAENAADGTGLRTSEFDRLIQAGYDVVTLGDHVYKKKEIIERLRHSDRLLRPLNFPATSAGKGFTITQSRNGTPVCVISLMGRVFMRPVDCPFAAFSQLMENTANELPKIRIIDFHAEATSDKQTLGWFADGKVSAMVGTHTHVATADEQILPQGTAYLTDVGMTGPFRSVLGRDIQAVIEASIHFEPTSFHVATDDVRISGCWVDIDRSSGTAAQICRFQWSESLLQSWESEKKNLLSRL